MTNAVAVLESKPIGIRLAAALAGALAVALAAQLSIPIPGSPVPFTMQPLAVLIVGGLLGPRYGVVSLMLYLAMGAAGLPVFSPFGAPGIARFAGPTAGFLLAFPVAAGVVGLLRGPTLGRCFLACLAGMAVIFIGGAAGLMVLDRGLATLLTPFVAADLVKAALAALVIRRFA